MPITVTCGECEKQYMVRENAAGRKFNCKSCGEVVTVPLASSTTKDDAARKTTSRPRPSASSASDPATNSKSSSQNASKRKKPPSADQDSGSARSKTTPRKSSSTGARSAESTSGTPRRRKNSGGAAAAANRQQYDEYETAEDEYEYVTDEYDDYGDDYQEYEPAPRRSTSRRSTSRKTGKKKTKSKSSRGSGFSIAFNVNRLNLILVIAGGMGILFGIREARLAAGSSSEPTLMAAADLVANGPGDNLYVTVTGIEGDLEETVIYYTETRSGEIQRIDEVYVPARPAGSSPTAPIKLIVYSNNARTEGDVAGVASGTQHTGMIVNDIMSISGDKRALLETTPNLNVDSAYILHSGRTPSGAGLVLLYFLGGGVLLAGGLYWIFLVPESSD